MAEPVRIAVVGAGLVGQAHIRRVLDEPQASLAAIVDPAPAAREQAAALGVPHFGAIEPALAAGLADAVVIAVPNRLHVPCGLAVVAAGLPMLLEKPIADTVGEAMVLVEAAEAAGAPILVGHHRRHSPAIREARSAIASGALGRIVAVNAMALMLKPDRYFEGPGAWRTQLGGGVLLINLIHLIDDLRTLCGEVVAVQAADSRAARGFEVEDTAAAILHFASGALGVVAISDAAAAPWSWELTAGENKAYPQTDQFCYAIAGSKGSLTVPRLELWRHEGGDGWWSPMAAERRALPEEDPLTLQMRHFCAVARGEAAPLVDGREGTRSLEVTLSLAQAARTGALIRLDGPQPVGAAGV